MLYCNCFNTNSYALVRTGVTITMKIVLKG